MNQNGTNYTDINRFLPNLPMIRPHALQFGPDGALYMIEWGSGFDGNNADSGVYRIDYVEGNRAPIARATADKTSGPAPLTVAVRRQRVLRRRPGDAAGLTYAWDFDGDGTTDATTPTGTFTYAEAGNYTARLTVTDEGGRTGTTNIDIVVGNTAPTVELTLPVDGGFFEFGDYLALRGRGHRPRGRRRSTATGSSSSPAWVTTSTPTATSSTPAAAARSRCPATPATSVPTSSASSRPPTPTTGPATPAR